MSNTRFSTLSADLQNLVCSYLHPEDISLIQLEEKPVESIEFKTKAGSDLDDLINSVFRTRLKTLKKNASTSQMRSRTQNHLRRFSHIQPIQNLVREIQEWTLYKHNHKKAALLC